MITFAEEAMRNILLETLAATENEAFAPFLREIELRAGEVLAQPGDDIDKVVFPHSGIVSFFVLLDDSSSVQTLMVGRDGAIGAAQAFDNRRSLNKIVVQVPGNASVIHRDHLRRIATEHCGVRQILAAHEQFIVADIQQTAACNARHDIEQRCARWLLRMRDLVGNDIPITQAALADMIGVRRTSVSDLAVLLKRGGTLDYSRGRVRVRDAQHLQASACECHQTVRKNYEDLFGTLWPTAAKDPRTEKDDQSSSPPMTSTEPRTPV